ncbi:MAG: S9 family peptidase [Candidatus Schekmanbacteria bacterium]|nr:S9 family peptidase [Candidatus Schekmanbacteria bacterium]
MAHGHTRVDNYQWFRKRDDPAVLAHLAAENAYFKAVMAPTERLQEELYQEYRARIKQTDMTAPFRLGSYEYYKREEEGRAYPIYCRRALAGDAPEETILDVNALALGHPYTAVGTLEPSDDHRLVAYAADYRGDRLHRVKIRDVCTGRDLPDEIEGARATLVWAADNATFYYVRSHPETLRPYRVYCHRLGEEPARDELVFEEADETFLVTLQRSRSRRFICIYSLQTLTTEMRVVDAMVAAAPSRVLIPRRRGHRYFADHIDDAFFIRTNDAAPDFRVVRAPTDNLDPAAWVEVVPHRDGVHIADMEVFSEHLVCLERSGGLPRLRITSLAGDNEHLVAFDEAAFDAALTQNYEADAGAVRFRYSSMRTPPCVFDYDLRAHHRIMRKQEEILGGFDPESYCVERLHARAEDGTDVPISVLYRPDLRRPGENPCLLFGYGSYGICMDAGFSPFRITLVDRGFVFAIAHLRGGRELGERWYESGKLLTKKNTFTDFVACAEHLIRRGYSAPDRLYARGGSAGGLLMGAVANMRPDLFKAIVARVPFFDVVTTMLDSSIPLTTFEYDEWGNPHDETYYRYMLSYSPYDNISTLSYPHMLVMTSLFDSQVSYCEPAKYVAKMREMKIGDNLLLLRTDFEAGHSGSSGRYDRYREIAIEDAFVLALEGIGASLIEEPCTAKLSPVAAV